jgi:DNA-directed RNA polymerase specialized sigma24 family protein
MFWPMSIIRWPIFTRRDLFSYLIRQLGNADDAQEVLQRFVLRALERSNDLHDVRGWLARVLSP